MCDCAGVLQRRQQRGGALVQYLGGRPQGVLDLRSSAFQRLANALLLRHRLRAHALPLGTERAGRALHRTAPAFQALLICRQLGGVRLGGRLLQRGHQGAGALVERLGDRRSAPSSLATRASWVWLAVQGGSPGIRHLARGALPLGRKLLAALGVGGRTQSLVRALGLLRQGDHRLFDHGANRLANLARTGAQAVLQRCPHGAGQLGVGRGGFAVKALLLGQQLFTQLTVAALQALHQAVQALGNQRQGLGLGLQGQEHFFAPMGRRERPEQRGDARIEQAHRLQPLAAAHGRQQAQHGRRRHPGNRGAK